MQSIDSKMRDKITATCLLLGIFCVVRIYPMATKRSHYPHSHFSFFKDLCTILSNYSNFITIFVALYDIDIILRERIYCFLINILNADIYY